ncbi:segregation/condensation protein A [bacterium]|nr:segregation/condensation protein A [bacterium]
MPVQVEGEAGGAAEPGGFTVTLDRFTGPLDLLLYLIKKNQMDILELPVAPITDQYVQYIESQKDVNLEVAGEYMAMASELLQLKSRMILPRPPVLESEESDPRRALVDRLLLYRRIQAAGGVLKDRSIAAAKRFYRGTVDLAAPYRKGVILLQEATLFTLLAEYRIVLDAARGRRRPPEEIAIDASLVEERSTDILRRLSGVPFGEIVFDEVYFVAAPRVEVLVLLLSLLELSRLHLILVRQEAPFAAIRLEPGPRFRSDVPPASLLQSEQVFETDETPLPASPSRGEEVSAGAGMT